VPIALALACLACSSSRAQNRPRGQVTVNAQGTPVALAPDTLPACFAQDDPATLPAGDRQDAFSPLRRGATPAPGKAPHLSAMVADAPYALYALGAPAQQYPPVALRRNTATDGASRTLVDFTLQYRAPTAAGGAIVVLDSAPTAGTQPRVSDLDDSVDAVRLAARFAGRSTPDPLADPAAAFAALGCPQHGSRSVTVAGTQATVDVLRWSGQSTVLRLRLVLATTEVSLETAGLSENDALALAATLQKLTANAPLTLALARTFDGQPAAGR
jgi:hypothetical protein